MTDGDRDIIREQNDDARECEEAMLRDEQGDGDDWDCGYISREAELADLEAMIAEGEALNLMTDAFELDAKTDGIPW